MSNKLYGVWPMSYLNVWESRFWNPKDAPRCNQCKKIHWLSLATRWRGQDVCRAIVSDVEHIRDLERFRDLSKVEEQIVGFIEPAVLNPQKLLVHADEPMKCHPMHWMSLKQFWEENEHTKRMMKGKIKGIGGQTVFPTGGTVLKGK